MNGDIVTFPPIPNIFPFRAWRENDEIICSVMTSRENVSLIFYTWKDKCCFFNCSHINDVRATFVEGVSLSKERRESCGVWKSMSE